MLKNRERIQSVLFVIGFFVSVYGIYSAVLLNSKYWYSYFVIGSFLFFSFLNLRLNQRSTLNDLLIGRKSAYFIYLAYLLGTVLIDRVFGILIAKNWEFPRYGSWEQLVHVILIGYPFAFFSVNEMFSTINGLWKKIFQEKIHIRKQLSPLTKAMICWTAIFLFFAFFVGSIIIHLISPKININKIVFISALVDMFIFDSTCYLISKKSILIEIISGNKRIFLSLLTTVVLAAILHEVPNTFAWEWIYKNIPFTDIRIFNVNILVLTFGWLFLVYVAISVYALIYFIIEKKSLEY